jgi:hypothetical protein
MLTLQIPMLLALLGTALMAVVIFAPSRVPAPATTSFSPPPAPPAVGRWEPPPAMDAWDLPMHEPAAPLWPTLIDRRAANCDAVARLGLVEALATVRTPWSEAILRRALDDEPDPTVRAAVVTALAA